MFKFKIPASLEAIAILIGTIIGSGIFLLPFAAISSGLLVSNIWMVLLTILLIIMHLVFGEVVLRTRHTHSFAGYAGKYLSKSAEKFIFVSSLITLSFSSMIYLLLASKFLGSLLPVNFLSFNVLFGICWVLFNICSCVDLSRASKFNLLLTIGEVGMTCAIAFYIFPHIKMVNFQSFNITHNWLMSYGVIFYALNGIAAIPLVFHLLRERKAKPVDFRKTIIIGSIIVTVCYLLFMNCIALVSGGKTTQDAISGLLEFVGGPIIALGALAGILIVWTSYISFSQYLKTLLHNDFKWSHFWSTMTVVFLPLAFFFIGIDNIGDLISLMGGVLGGLDGLIIFFVYFASQKKSEIEPEYKLNLKPIVAWVIGGFFFASSLMQIVLQAMKK